MAESSATWQLRHAHHLGLTVGDIERSVTFYRDLLGLSLLRRRSSDANYLGAQTGHPGLRLEMASFQLASHGGPTLELVQYMTHAGAVADPSTNRAGNTHLCFQVDDIQRAYDSLRGRGVRFLTPPVTITSGPNRGGIGVYLFDPDGYTLELFQPATGGVSAPDRPAEVEGVATTAAPTRSRPRHGE
jgi:catechol 2,3-dioxygenase-like lactoylglutathione lyase family enzyme